MASGENRAGAFCLEMSWTCVRALKNISLPEAISGHCFPQLVCDKTQRIQLVTFLLENKQTKPSCRKQPWPAGPGGGGRLGTAAVPVGQGSRHLSELSPCFRPGFVLLHIILSEEQ